MTQDEGPRIVSKFVERVQLDYVHDASPKTSINYTRGNATGWVLIDADTDAPVLQWQGFIDLSGYRPDDMVLFPQAVECQRGASVYGLSLEPAAGGVPPYTIAGGEFFMQYALTTDKVDDIDFGLGSVAEPLVGFISDNSEMDQVIYSVSESWAPPAVGIGMNMIQKHVSGDGVPIVGPRIYVTIRALFTPRVKTSDGGFYTTSWLVPPMRFVINGTAAKVPEFQLLHLMKRQIDLQQSPDVDQ